MSPRISVVARTVLEGADRQRLDEALTATLSSAGWSHELIVVGPGEDGPDPLQAGLATARGDLIVIVDPRQHPVERLAAVVSPIAEGRCDFVVGTSGRRGRMAGWLARPLAAIRDPLSGCVAFDRSCLPAAAGGAVTGPAIALDLLVRGGFTRPGEVAFEPRANGAADAAPAPRFGYLRHLVRLYRHRFPVRTEFVQFGLVGASGFVVDLAIYLALQLLLGIEHLAARALSFWGSATWNWALNRHLTFADRKRTRKRVQWPAFLLSSVLGFGLNWGTYYTLTTFVPFFDGSLERILAMMIGVGVGMGLNFLLARLFVFLPAAGR